MKPIVVIIFCLTILLNLWVWIFPDSFVHFIEIAKKSKLAELSFQKVLWELIDHPNYIWLPRSIFLIALVIVIILILAIQ